MVQSMSLVSKPEFAPLLAPGRHRMSMRRLSDICVSAFPTSTNRQPLFQALLQLISDLATLNIPCEIWIDGSYLTAKIEPDDIDLSVRFAVEDFDRLDPMVQNTIMSRLSGKTYHPRLDTYAFVSGPRDHEYADIFAETENYWAEWWSVARAGWLKGVAVVRLGETNVGLRILS
ncbi:hypothetical protein [Ancylobacter sp. TS-1]|uniref:DUF6932 family protein n=1 Tax=Ancylobacter sp. TS-1 TaxID=1850374 RepID=UPI00352E70CD